MPKQYTFRTTRKTEWLEKFLDEIPKQDRSDFIRTMIILGIEMSKEGVNPSDINPSDINPSDVIQKLDKSISFDTQRREPSFEEIETFEPNEDILGDIENRLDNLYN